MKNAALAALVFAISAASAAAQQLRETPLDAAELAAKLGIYIYKFQVSFSEPAFATITLHEDEKESSFETTRPAKDFSISFEATPSELAAKNPKHVSFHGNITGLEGKDGTFASVNRDLEVDPRMFREGLSVGRSYLDKLTPSSPAEPKETALRLDEEICLFEYTITGRIDKTPAHKGIRGCVTFSKSPRKKP